MLKLYDNAFSPFARKVQLVLRHKGLDFDTFDGLSRANRGALASVNGRIEVPTLDHDGLLISNSAEIVAYLERAFPERPVYPSDHATWVKARMWERCSDTVVDSILVDISYWTWADREDEMPTGLLEAARQDMDQVYDALEGALEGGDWICGSLSVADMALFPHLSATRVLDVPIDGTRHSRLLAWYKRCRSTALFAEDLGRLKTYLSDPAGIDVERKRIFWRGDRIEWMLARGFHPWFLNEIEAGRVIWPGLGIPKPSPKFPEGA